MLSNTNYTEIQESVIYSFNTFTNLPFKKIAMKEGIYKKVKILMTLHIRRTLGHFISLHVINGFTIIPVSASILCVLPFSKWQNWKLKLQKNIKKGESLGEKI